MRVPLSWLRDYAPLEGSADELASALSGLGLVVEGVERVGEGLGDIVVAEVLATRPHPGADRVQLVDVTTGDGDVRQIVCGAFNFGAGELVPLAPAGARLPGGMEIGRRKVRGQWSEGMLCSGAELGLSDDGDGILVLPGGLAPGMLLTEALGITPDMVFDLDITPNRPDALSILGVARDLAAKLKVPLAIPDVPMPVVGAGGGEPLEASIEVLSPELCPRFTGTVLSGVVVGPSPGWMASRLTLAGMRPINNVVDVSNYVMLGLGQPNHPYDLERLPGAGLVVRAAEAGEVLVTLDGVERRFSPEDCLICDAEGRAVGIGGIMGGASTEITDTTRTVLLEAAYFTPMAIARTSKRLALRTEASIRFERGVDPEGIERAVARFCQFAAEVAGGEVVRPTRDVSAELPARPRVVVRTARVNSILGTNLSTADVSGYLEPIGFTCEPAEGNGAVTVTIPSWRPDSEREIDVVEEVARHHGYGNIVRTLPPVTQVGGLTAAQRARRRVREVLVGAGLSEAWSTSLLAPADLERAGLPAEAVEVENPLAQEESVLRTSLLPGLLRAVAVNVGHRHPDVRLFELGNVFLPPPGAAQLPNEPERVGAILAGGDATAAKRLLDTLLGALGVEAGLTGLRGPNAETGLRGPNAETGRRGPNAETGLRGPNAGPEAAPSPGLHPARSAGITLAGSLIGAVGEIDPDVLAAHDLAGPVGWLELDLDPLLAVVPGPRQYRPVSRFPSADFDLAFVVEEAVPAAQVENVLRQTAGDMLEDLWLFDVFRGPQLGQGRRSLGYRLRVAALDRTLSEEELADVRRRCIAAVEASTGAALRT